jgi:PAS domain S-box-containing protein
MADFQHRIADIVREGVAEGTLPESLADALGEALGELSREREMAGLASSAEQLRYRELLEAVASGCVSADSLGVIREADAAATALLGGPPDGLAGQPLAAYVAEEDRPGFLARLARLQAATASAVQQWPVTLQPQAGVAIPAMLVVFPWCDAEGHLLSLSCLLYDRAAHRSTPNDEQASESKYRALLSPDSELAFALDAAGHFTYVSPFVEQITLHKPQELVGLHFDQVFHAATLDLQPSATGHDLAMRANPQRYHVTRKDGVELSVRVVQRALMKDGHVLGVAGLMSEATEAEEHERESRAVSSLAIALRSASQLADIVQIVLDQGQVLLNAEGSALALRNLESGETEFLQGRGEWSHWGGVRLPAGAGICGQVIATGQPFSRAEATADAHLARPDMLGSLPAVACCPLSAQGQTFGALIAGRHSGFSEGDLRVLTVLSEIAAGSIHRVRLYEQRERLYSQLESRERFIARIVDTIPSSLLVVDRSLRIVSVNRNFTERTRRDARNTIGHRMDEVFPSVLLDYTHLDQKVREVFRTGQAIDGGKVSYRAPNVPSRVYYYRCIPLKTNEAAVENVMLLMDDITEREQLGEDVRRAERHLASVVECANDLVISTDALGCIVTCNRAVEAALSRATGELRGQQLSAFCLAAHRPMLDGLIEQLRRGQSVRSTEVNLLTPDNREVPIAWSCSPMLDDASKLTGMVMVGRDLTERRRLEEQLIQSAKMASLGVMAGGIAHELRNPLGIISASAQLLLECPTDIELASECSERIWAATQRASLIIENLLKFARPQREQAVGLDLNAALLEILTVLENQLALHKVVLDKQLQSDLPTIRGNAALLQQVFANIVLNACNAMPHGGTLVVSSLATEREVVFRFADTGCGIPPDHLSKIFDPFFTTMPVGKGIGLGLSISYSIVQQHQGAIEVQSELGKGTVFTVRLPTHAGASVG